MGARRFLVVASAVLLVACAVSQQQLVKDLAAAHASQCLNSQTEVQNVDCYDSIDRPIWQREASDTFNLYLRFYAESRAVAMQYDNRLISTDGFNAALKSYQTELWTQVAQANNANDNATLLMLMGTSFVNGYNSAQPAPMIMTTCTPNGTTVNCLSY